MNKNQLFSDDTWWGEYLETEIWKVKENSTPQTPKSHFPKSGFISCNEILESFQNFMHHAPLTDISEQIRDHWKHIEMYLEGRYHFELQGSRDRHLSE